MKSIKEHIINEQKKYFICLLLGILILPSLLYFIQKEPLIKGEESFFLLNQTKFPLSFFQFEPLLVIGAIAIALATYLLVTHTVKTKKEMLFVATLIALLSPITIATYMNPNPNAVFILCSLLAFYFYKKKAHTWLSIPFILIAASITLLHSIFLLTLLIVIYWKEKKLVSLISISSTVLISCIGWVTAYLPWSITDTNGSIQLIISDLGAASGVSFFLILVSFIGISTNWKKKGTSSAYMLLFLTAIFFFLRVEFLVFFAIMIMYFATSGYLYLFKKEWKIKQLQELTTLLLILGIIFSTISYIERATTLSPDTKVKQASQWIFENTKDETIILSNPKEAQIVQYLTKRHVLYLPSKDKKSKQKIVQNMSTTLYIKDLFPLLEENNINTIFITPQMRKSLPKEQGLLFLLQNERFKLAHEREDTQVWFFLPEEK